MKIIIAMVTIEYISGLFIIHDPIEPPNSICFYNWKQPGLFWDFTYSRIGVIYRESHRALKDIFRCDL